MQHLVSKFMSIFDLLMDQQQIIPTLNQLAPAKRIFSLFHLQRSNVKVELALKTAIELIC